MPFEKNLRRLIKKLPEHDLPSGLHSRVFSQRTEPDRLQKGGFDMKLALIPALALSAMGLGMGGLVLLKSIASRDSKTTMALLPQTSHLVPTGPVTLHFVDEVGKPVPKVSVNLWGYEKPNPETGVPPLRAGQMPQGTTDTNGDLIITPEMRVVNFSASVLAERSRWAAGELTVSKGIQTVMLSEHPEHSITGQLLDEGGKPLGGVKPELYVVSSQTTQSLMTGPNGRFIAWIVPGEEYRLTLTVPGHAPYVEKGIRIERGGKVDLGIITIRSGSTKTP